MLSAFVIVSLSMLQQDTGQTSVSLLLQLSSQTANSSQPAASLPDFQPPNSAVWINSLWFLSLILSLTSALFGMIAKQWLREYMEWTTTSWLPQRTITLRQKRFEAFEEYKVPAIIATIPALLEVALILFFSGLIIFLWTINRTVAGVSIAAIGTSITLAILATVLPVFHRRCPYKSPTGWACLRLVWPIAGTWEGLRRKLYVRSPPGSHLERLAVYLRCDKYSSWRERDFASGSAVLSKEASNTLRGAEVRFVSKGGVVIDFKSARRDVRSVNIAALGRAFAWIHATSQNEPLLDAVVHCAETRVIDRCAPLALLAFDFSVTCQALGMEPRWMCNCLDRLYDITLEGDRVEHASLRHDWRHWLDEFWLSTSLDRLRRTQPHLVTQLAKTLTRNLNELLSTIDLERAYENKASARFLMRIAAFCISITSKVNDDRTFVDCLAPPFLKLLDIDAVCELRGLRSTLFELLFLHPDSIVELDNSCKSFIFAC